MRRLNLVSALVVCCAVMACPSIGLASNVEYLGPNGDILATTNPGPPEGSYWWKDLTTATWNLPTGADDALQHLG